jgi:hypothetical protein
MNVAQITYLVVYRLKHASVHEVMAISIIAPGSRMRTLLHSEIVSAIGRVQCSGKESVPIVVSS